MTRIFDALRKARTHAPPAPPQPVAPVPAVSAPPVAPLAPVARAAARAPVAEMTRVVFTPTEPARLTALPPLGGDVLREMSTMRVHLEAALPDRSRRTVMLVSAQGGEGTTTVAAQLAATLARDGSIRVLLVDANGLRPSLSMRLDSAAASGAKDGARPDRLHALPLPKELRGPAGIPPQALRQLLEPVEKAYDWIVVDGPPVLGSPDAAALAGVMDGVVVVVQAGRTKRPVLTRSIELLRKAGARVLGTVLNRRRLEIPGFIYRRI